jgi:hypothetical protein
MGADGTGQTKLNRLSAQSLLVAVSNQLVGNGLSKRGNKRGKTCSTKLFHLSAPAEELQMLMFWLTRGGKRLV